MNNTDKATKTKQHWDNELGLFVLQDLTQRKIDELEKNEQYLMHFLSDACQPKMKIADLGCGNGYLSVHLALWGARVDSFDIAPIGVKHTKALARHNKVDQLINVYLHDLHNPLPLPDHSCDAVVGKFVLHHLDPLEPLLKEINRVLKPGSFYIFLENSNRNFILRFFRSYIAGKAFNSDKNSDDFEEPLNKQELIAIKKYLPGCRFSYPALYFFQMAGKYIPSLHLLFRMAKHTDALIGKICPFLRRYSYWFIIEGYKPKK